MSISISSGLSWSLLLSISLALHTAQAADATMAVPAKIYQCNKYTLTVQENPDDSVETVGILRDRQGQQVAKFQDAHIKAAECTDLTADGIPEWQIETFSGGAHCCSVNYVYSLTEPARIILEVATANTPGFTAEQIDGQGPLELISWDNRFAYAYDMSFAESPFLPIVYSYIDGQYLDNTRSFPAILKPAEPVKYSGDVILNMAILYITGREKEIPSFIENLPNEEFKAWAKSYYPTIRNDINDFGMTDWIRRAGISSASASGMGGYWSEAGKREFMAWIKGPTLGLDQNRYGIARIYYKNGKFAANAKPVLQIDNMESEYGIIPVLSPGLVVTRKSNKDDMVLKNNIDNRLMGYRLLNDQLQPLNDDALTPVLSMLSDWHHRSALLDKINSGSTVEEAKKYQALYEGASSTANTWLTKGSKNFMPVALVADSITSLQETKDTAVFQATVLATFTDAAKTSDSRWTITFKVSNKQGVWDIDTMTYNPMSRGPLYWSE